MYVKGIKPNLVIEPGLGLNTWFVAHITVTNVQMKPIKQN